MTEETKLYNLESALKPYQKVLSEATDAILDQEVSSYPIFVLTDEMAEIGVPVLDELSTMPTWSVRVSSLEEFSTKQIIRTERVNDFRSIYKDPKSFFCLFILERGGAQFVFLPRS